MLHFRKQVSIDANVAFQRTVHYGGFTNSHVKGWDYERGTDIRMIYGTTTLLFKPTDFIYFQWQEILLY